MELSEALLVSPGLQGINSARTKWVPKGLTSSHSLQAVLRRNQAVRCQRYSDSGSVSIAEPPHLGMERRQFAEEVKPCRIAPFPLHLDVACCRIGPIADLHDYGRCFLDPIPGSIASRRPFSIVLRP